MSMLDAFFNNRGFKASKCKTLLKLTIPRIKLLRNRREIQLKQMRRDIAKLLENGQEATARIRVEHIIREENMMAAQEILELFCELVAVRLPIIETQRECPLDLKEAISSICFAAPRCSDLTELLQVQMQFAAKYGREFVAAATELMPDSGVNRQIIELLSVRAPSVEAKLKLLKEIAEEHELDWDPADTETELLKPHEDLLNGPSHITSSSTLPLPEEKHNEPVSSISSKPTVEIHEEPDSEADFDSLDLPEVPKVSVRATSDTPSAPDIIPPRPHSPPRQFHLDSKNTKSTPDDDEPELDNQDLSTPNRENKQFQYIPFATPPSVTLSSKQSDPTSPHPHHIPHDPTPSFSHTDTTPSFSHTHTDTTPSFSHTYTDTTPSFSHRPTKVTPSISNTKIEANADFQDVLAAAQAAAESAERAATAARAAASLAQVRISELVTRKNGNGISDSGEKNGSHEGLDQQGVVDNPKFDQQNSFRNAGLVPNYDSSWGLGSPGASSDNVFKMDDGSPDSKLQGHQPQRSTSLEDDPYFSYPNLFTRQDSGDNPGTHSSVNNSQHQV